jgi:hypothetical protein
VTGLQQVVLEALASRRALLIFAAANLLFLLLDVGLAHSAYLHTRLEYVPLVTSVVGGTLAFVLGWLELNRPAVRIGLTFVAALSLITGAWGLFLHLGAESLRKPTLYQLVYSAPIVAPLSYAGLGLLIAAAIYLPSSSARGRSAELLAGFGLFGNFILCLLDHARNGFWAPVEWVSVAAGAFGGVALVTEAAFSEGRRSERRFVWGTLAAMVAVAVLGTTLHLLADLRPQALSILERLRYGAPVFAPLLFGDLAALGALGLLSRSSASG